MVVATSIVKNTESSSKEHQKDKLRSNEGSPL
jgi:hypothetical protein